MFSVPFRGTELNPAGMAVLPNAPEMVSASLGRIRVSFSSARGRMFVVWKPCLS